MRVKRNPRYSISAFARDLQFPTGSLSGILSGKRNVSYKACQKIFKIFHWPTQKKMEFMYSAAREAKKLGTQRIHPEFKRILSNKDSILFEAEKIDQEVFITMSEWYHVAILEMTFTEELSKNTTEIIAKRLGISKTLAKKAVTRLLKLGFLEEKNGSLKKTHKSMCIANPEKTNEGLMKHQEKALKMAAKKLKTDPIELRNNSAMAMAIDPEKIPLAKKEIRLFLHKMCQLLESGHQQKVYQLNINLFSLES